MSELATRVHLLLRAGGHTVATAESLTGGRLAALLTDTPGASETYLGGVVTYATELKHSILDVPREIIDGVGVVSAECAEAMATGVKAITGSSYAIATTGVAGPDAQEGKPPGTVYVGLAGPGLVTSALLELSGGRTDIQAATCERALQELEDVLRREEPAVG
ncbi:CinA family protein [Nocardioides sp. KR10-350]|uniref:CinA family protein n=1 Tax=Nocardioides cheoyonin TaxID=3156615 RepID=UPI0032B55007